MRYLFGDSTDSALEINYLALLRDAIDFGVISTPEMPDIWNLIEYLTQELDEFHAVD